MARRLWRTAAIAALLVGLAAALLALPVESWRRGEPASSGLRTEPARPPTAPARLWIDTDAACGAGPTTDPDDCLALLTLSRTGAPLAGVSTVFGNAPLPTVDRTTRGLVSRLQPGSNLAVARGCAQPGCPGAAAVSALQAALEREPLVIVALGPLTNIAAALRDRPDLHRRVARLVIVMGRRRGHIFHPVEGGTAGSWLGHGPVFRDFNFAKDPAAAREVAAWNIPLISIPYEVGRDVMVTRDLLDRLTAQGGAAAWVAHRANAWLHHWREDIGVAGFYPFDLLAAAFAVEPGLFGCARVELTVGPDAGLAGALGSDGLFARRAGPGAADRYCPDLMPGAAARIRGHLLAGRRR